MQRNLLRKDFNRSGPAMHMCYVWQAVIITGVLSPANISDGRAKPLKIIFARKFVSCIMILFE